MDNIDIETFGDWFLVSVKKHYKNGKTFSDEEKFPLSCVYRWSQGIGFPRPSQISCIVKIFAQREYKSISDKPIKENTLVWEIVYSKVASDVMILLEREIPYEKSL
jgi:hypothetical protein